MRASNRYLGPGNQPDLWLHLAVIRAGGSDPAPLQPYAPHCTAASGSATTVKLGRPLAKSTSTGTTERSSATLPPAALVSTFASIRITSPAAPRARRGPPHSTAPRRWGRRPRSQDERAARAGG